MAYLGTPPQSGFITTAKQRVTSSTNAYVDLDHSISSIADVIVFVNFVKQDTTNLTLTTSSRITLGATLVSSDIVEIHYLGKAVNTQTPGTATVTNDMLAGSITESKLAGSIGLDKLSATGTKSSSTFLRGDNTFQTISSVSGNTGQFRVYSSSFTLANSTDTLITGWTEEFDLSNYFASDKYTPTVAGKYYFHYSARFNNVQVGDRFKIALKKNGAEIGNSNGEISNSRTNSYPTVEHSIIVDADGSGDYFEIMMFQNVGVSAGIFDLVFEGFKLSA
jgi:hypothetical protein